MNSLQYVQATRLILAPITVVWERYADHLAWNDWARMGNVIRTRDGNGAPNGVGSIRCITSAGVKVYEEVIAYEPPHRQQYRVVKGGPGIKDHLGEVILAPRANATFVIWRCQFAPMIPGTGPLLRLFITGIFRRSLTGLERTFRETRSGDS